MKSPYYREVHSILKDLDVSLSSSNSESSSDKLSMSDHSKNQRRILAEAKSDARDSHAEFNRQIEEEIRKADEKSKLIC